ncbi:MAG: GNAT family N-acetyltransferase [Chthoniobacterales bacterium]
MEIIRASAADAARLSQLAQNAKAHWGYPASWLAEWRHQLTIAPEFIEKNATFVLRDDKRDLGFYALVITDREFFLEHLWVSPDSMRRGIGRRLFQHAVAQAGERGARYLTIESDPHAEPFYLRMGALRVGTHPTEVDGRPRELPLLRLDLNR